MNGAAKIRKALQSDVPAMVALVAEVWPDCEQAALSFPIELADMFSNAVHRPTFFVAELDGVLVGCAGWNWAWHNYDMYEFFWASVRGLFRGRGIGSALLQERLRDIAAHARPGMAQYVTLSTHLESHYSKFGFKTIASMPSIINTGEQTTHLMMLDRIITPPEIA